MHTKYKCAIPARVSAGSRFVAFGPLSLNQAMNCFISSGTRLDGGA